MIPFKLHVGPVVYDVQAVDRLQGDHGEDVAGLVTHCTEEVKLDAALPKCSQHVTVMHELLHTIFQQAGQREWYDNEAMLDCLAYGLVGAKVEGQGVEVALLEPLFAIMADG